MPVLQRNLASALASSGDAQSPDFVLLKPKAFQLSPSLMCLSPTLSHLPLEYDDEIFYYWTLFYKYLLVFIIYQTQFEVLYKY